jgi:hypothetical protein
VPRRQTGLDKQETGVSIAEDLAFTALVEAATSRASMKRPGIVLDKGGPIPLSDNRRFVL